MREKKTPDRSRSGVECGGAYGSVTQTRYRLSRLSGPSKSIEYNEAKFQRFSEEVLSIMNSDMVDEYLLAAFLLIEGYSEDAIGRFQNIPSKRLRSRINVFNLRTEGAYFEQLGGHSWLLTPEDIEDMRESL